MTLQGTPLATSDFAPPFDGDVVSDVFEPRTCANCDSPVPSFRRWCSDRCYKREDEGQ